MHSMKVSCYHPLHYQNKPPQPQSPTGSPPVTGWSPDTTAQFRGSIQTCKPHHSNLGEPSTPTLGSLISFLTHLYSSRTEFHTVPLSSLILRANFLCRNAPWPSLHLGNSYSFFWIPLGCSPLTTGSLHKLLSLSFERFFVLFILYTRLCHNTSPL